MKKTYLILFGMLAISAVLFACSKETPTSQSLELENLHDVVLSRAIPPAITSATVRIDNTIQINGTNFGVKNPAAPLVWDTFENGALGNAIQNTSAIVGNWQSGAGSDNVFYSSERSYAGNKSAYHRFTPSQWNSSLSKNNNSGYPIVFMDWKEYFPSSNNKISNYKIFRLYGNNDTKQWFPGAMCSVGVIEFTGIETFWDPGLPRSQWDRWIHYQFGLKESSTSTSSDGVLFGYKDAEPYGYFGTNYQTRIENSAYFDQIRIGHYFDVGARDGCDPNDNSKTFSDNVYIDITFARVEIGDNSNYDYAAREIQIPTSWSSTNITATLNPGKLFDWASTNLNENLKIFVVNAENQKSVGNLDREGPTTISIIGQLSIAYNTQNQTNWVTDLSKGIHGFRYVENNETYEVIFYRNILDLANLNWNNGSKADIIFVGKMALLKENLLDSDYLGNNEEFIASYKALNNSTEYVIKRKVI